MSKNSFIFMIFAVATGILGTLQIKNQYDLHKTQSFVRFKGYKIIETFDSTAAKVDVMAAFDGTQVEPNYVYKAFSGCNPKQLPPGNPPAPYPEIGPQKDDWWFPKVHGEAGVGKNRGESVAVCVIDTGVAPHPDLKFEKIFSAIGDDGIDRGIGHGTAVSSVIAALDDAKGIRGISQAKLYSCRALGNDGSGNLDAIAVCVNRCVDETPSKVINMSLGGPQGSQLLYNVIAYAKSKGVTVIAAAGNGGPNDFTNFPARYDNVISVSATGSNDVITSFSSRGKVQYSAPGHIMLLAVPVNATMCNGASGYCQVSGTSFSSPLVAGICAVAFANGKSCDNLGVELINGPAEWYGVGRVNLAKTLL